MSSRRRTNSRIVTRRPHVYRTAPNRRGKTSNIKCAEDSEEILLLSNLGPDMSSKIINEVFGEFGKVIKAVIHCNEDEVQMGTAEVWMSNNKANKAKSKLNATDIFRDGRIIRIEKPTLTARKTTFWQNVYKHISGLNVKIPEISIDSKN